MSSPTKNKKNIAIIICWYGTYPWYFSYFIHSCAYNPTIEFFIVTGNEKPFYNLPNNVKTVHKTLDEIKKRATEKLNLDVNLDCPYKLCDFKPAYGFLFPEIIDEYDFWGHGDIDVIYGNIRNFITDEILKSYDVITVRHDFLVGYFTLYRNCKKVNELFMLSKDYKKVFTTQKHFCFDECNFAFWKLDHDISFEDVADQCEIESMTHVVKKLHREKKLNAYFDMHAVEGVEGKLLWEKGTLIFKHQFEVILYHLIILKKIYSPKTPRHIPDKFRISPTRIYPN
jgi:hypothetical protein